MIQITGISYYNPATDAYEATAPSITAGQTGGIAVTVKNDTLLERDVTVDVVIAAPDGSILTASDTKAIAAGSSGTFTFTFTASESGQYSASAEVVLGTKNFTNLLTNGSFEAGDPPTGWSSDGGTFSRSSTQVKVGTYSGKLVNNPGVVGSFWQPVIPFEYLRNRAVTFGMWVYASDANRVRQDIWGGAGGYVGSSVYHPGVPGWVWLTVSGVVPAAATTVAPYLIILSGASIGAYGDEAILVEGDCCPGLVGVVASSVVATVTLPIIQQMVPLMITMMIVGMMMKVMSGLVKK